MKSVLDEDVNFVQELKEKLHYIETKKKKAILLQVLQENPTGYVKKAIKEVRSFAKNIEAIISIIQQNAVLDKVDDPPRTIRSSIIEVHNSFGYVPDNIIPLFCAFLEFPEKERDFFIENSNFFRGTNTDDQLVFLREVRKVSLQERKAILAHIDRFFLCIPAHTKRTQRKKDALMDFFQTLLRVQGPSREKFMYQLVRLYTLSMSNQDICRMARSLQYIHEGERDDAIECANFIYSSIYIGGKDVVLSCVGLLSREERKCLKEFCARYYQGRYSLPGSESEKGPIQAKKNGCLEFMKLALRAIVSYDQPQEYFIAGWKIVHQLRGDEDWEGIEEMVHILSRTPKEERKGLIDCFEKVVYRDNVQESCKLLTFLRSIPHKERSVLTDSIIELFKKYDVIQKHLVLQRLYEIPVEERQEFIEKTAKILKKLAAQEGLTSENAYEGAAISVLFDLIQAVEEKVQYEEVLYKALDFVDNFEGYVSQGLKKLMVCMIRTVHTSLDLLKIVPEIYKCSSSICDYVTTAEESCLEIYYNNFLLSKNLFLNQKMGYKDMDLFLQVIEDIPQEERVHIITIIEKLSSMRKLDEKHSIVQALGSLVPLGQKEIPMVVKLLHDMTSREIGSFLPKVKEVLGNDISLLDPLVEVLESKDTYRKEIILDAILMGSQDIRTEVIKELLSLLSFRPSSSFTYNLHAECIKKIVHFCERKVLAEDMAQLILEIMKSYKLSSELSLEEIEHFVLPLCDKDARVADLLSMYKTFLDIKKEERKEIFAYTQDIILGKTIHEKHYVAMKLRGVPSDQRSEAVAYLKELLVDTTYRGRDIFFIVDLFFSAPNDKEARARVMRDMQGIFHEEEQSGSGLLRLFQLLAKNVFPLPGPILFCLLPKEFHAKEKLLLLESDPALQKQCQEAVIQDLKEKLMKKVPSNIWLSNIIIAYSEILGLSKKDLLLIRAQQISKAKILPSHSNPFIIYRKLLAAAQKPIHFEPEGNEVDGVAMRISVPMLKKVLKASEVKREELPVIAQKWESFIKGLQEKREQNPERAKTALDALGTDWESIIWVISDDPIQYLKELTEKTTGPVSRAEAQWKKVLQAIFEASAASRPSLFFTEQEEMFIKVMMGIRSCDAGKDVGIAFAYEALDKKYHYPVQLESPTTVEEIDAGEKRRKALTFLENFVQEKGHYDIQLQLIEHVNKDTRESSELFSPLLIKEEYWDVDEEYTEYKLNNRGAVKLFQELGREKMAPFIREHVQDFIKEHFSQDSSVLKELLGLQTQASIHQAVYFENLIGPIFEKKEIDFDIHTDVLDPSWREITSEYAIKAFFRHVTINTLSLLLQKKLLLDSEKKFFIQCILEKPIDALQESDARKLLQKTGYIVIQPL